MACLNGMLYLDNGIAFVAFFNVVLVIVHWLFISVSKIAKKNLGLKGVDGVFTDQEFDYEPFSIIILPKIIFMMFSLVHMIYKVNAEFHI